MHRFAFPTAILFGAGARREVAPHLRERGWQRPLVVTDRGLAALPVFAAFLRDLDGVTHAVFSGVAGNPVASQVAHGADAYRAHDADSIIGIGGGAALDVAKAIALMATHPGDILDYAWDHPQVRPIGATLPYFVAVPTTAGTGSE
ncbi:MAG TPA: iron-containing alcohol dehydrogenase, partial [Casimicrobiaceae bacterium]